MRRDVLEEHESKAAADEKKKRDRGDKWVYSFGDGKAEGEERMRDLLGGKGAGLAEMNRMGLPVPAGFTITTEVCTHYEENDHRFPEGLEEEVDGALSHVETIMGSRFGDSEEPLLLSVRSGARVSMPGMMDTVLNLGLNEETVKGLAKKTGNERFAQDSYRRFVQMYGDVVLGLRPEAKDDLDPFEVIIEKKKKERGVKFDVELTADDLRDLVSEFKRVIHDRLDVEFPEDPRDQLWGAIGAVFRSWENERARSYRALNRIPDWWGTAVNVQAMVFGNLGEESGTGVAFTRDPATGEKVLYGEYLVNAQGEDVVAGIRTPRPMEELKNDIPGAYEQVREIIAKLEDRYRDMQDLEFTIERGKLWMLQTRSGKRTGLASVRIAVDMVREGLIDKKTALLRVDPDQLNQLLRPIFDVEAKRRAVDGGALLATGLRAGPGAATGKIVFNAEDAEAWAKRGEEVILVRIETSPEDIRGMAVAQGILTSRGGMTSHAALVARQMGRVCVAGCEALQIDYAAREMRVGERVLREGDDLSLDGTAGEVLAGHIDTRPSEVIQVLIDGTLEAEESDLFRVYDEFMGWADEIRRLKVRTNADQPKQSRTARTLGAEGIGLCRTEHMFFEGERIDSVRRMILSDTLKERRAALAEIQPMQRQDFIEIFREMDGLPVTIRTLDPPLHEFLPGDPDAVREVAEDLGIDAAELRKKIEALHETNPMLGHRGCRLGISNPEITEMQARAVFEAVVEVKKEGVDVLPEIMIPLVGHVNELRRQEEIVRRIAAEVMSNAGVEIPYLVGTMIEVPRAAVTADEIAEVADFFSFGTNDLTQLGMGISRDDSGRFIPMYVAGKIFPHDPFQSLDQEGVGKLVEMAVKMGRQVKGDLKIGICGEHGGDPASVEFCHRAGLDYVSCSPFRVPIARLAAAQAVLRGDD
jgi:pyruvate,orthophosphate dikinase